MISTVIELFGNIAAVLAGIIFFKRLPVAYRLIAIQALIGLAVETGGAVLLRLVPNAFLYNFYLLANFSLYLFAGYFLSEKKSRVLFAVIAVLISGIWILENNIEIKNHFYSFTLLAYAVVFVVLYSRILYDKIYRSSGRIFSVPELWLCTGIIIFFGCSVPYFLYFNHMAGLTPDQKKLVKILVLDIPNNINYLFTAVAFFLEVRMQPKPSALL